MMDLRPGPCRRVGLQVPPTQEATIIGAGHMLPYAPPGTLAQEVLAFLGAATVSG